MKLKKKRGDVSGDQCPKLIGPVGKVTLDSRLFPLRMDRKYRNILEQAEFDRNTKISRRRKFVQQYDNITSLMNSMEQKNVGNCNTGLLMELDKTKMVLKRKIYRLESELECFPQHLKGRSMTKDGIVDNNAMANRQNNSDKTSCKEQPQQLQQQEPLMGKRKSPSFQKAVQPYTGSSPTKRNRWSGSFKSQIFVRKGKSQEQPFSIDLFSSGRDLLQALADGFGEDLNAYNVMFGTKMIDQEKTLFEQEIYHGTTVDLNLRLQGGMHRRKKQSNKPKKKNKNSKVTLEIHNTEPPEMWTKPQVANWISEKCTEYEIDENEVSKLKCLNGKGLNMLSKDDWIRRSENNGDLLFNLWQELKPDNSTAGDEIAAKKSIGDNDEQGTLPQDREEKSTSFEPSEGCNKELDFHLNDQNNFRDGMIGEVSSIDDNEDLNPLQDFGTEGRSSTPNFGSILSVRGILESKSKVVENIGTMFIRDEPKGAASCFIVLMIDIQSDDDNTTLRPHTVKMLFENIRTGSQIGVRGRVKALEENDFVKNNSKCENLKFKLVIDSDQHSLVYVGGRAVAFKRQLSKPQWLHRFRSASFEDIGSFNHGDFIEKSHDTVFCDSSNIDGIMKYVVAFKNSFHGNILVGVKITSNGGQGEITGLDLNESEMAKWREKLSIAIENILPSSNEGAAICLTKEEALEFYEQQKSFIFVMDLLQSNKKIVWIHVPQGKNRLYVTKSSDVHAFVRKGAETKRLTDFADLFCRLDSLGSRKIIPISDEELDAAQQYKDVTGETSGLQKKYNVLTDLRYENQELEFKMIFGDDPVKTIQEKYLTHYSCGFLNSSGGSITFGVQEDEKSKICHIVGIMMSTQEREALVKTAVKTLSNFYPSVNPSQYSIVFHDVIVRSEYLAKHNDSSSCIIIHGPADEVGNKWPKFAKDHFPGSLCRVIRVRPQSFCIVLKRPKDASNDIGNIEEIVDEFVKQNKKQKILLKSMPEIELKPLLKKELCIVEFTVKRSQYPIHMVKPIDTYALDNDDGKLITLDYKLMMRRFELGFGETFSFNVKKFLDHVDNFNHSGSSYILISSPFELKSTENDVYGLVIPKWALAIDFDQNLKHEGHLHQLFNEFNDLHQMERKHFIKTPQDSKLGLNPTRGICWLAARGYDELENSLSSQDHGSWNMTHRDQLRSLLKTDLASSIKPNYLNIVVLWGTGHEDIVDSLRVILEDILSINGKRTAVTIVCCTNTVQRHITENLVKPLQKSYAEIIMEERVYVASPYVLARHLSSKLPDPYKSENKFQVPHKREYLGKPQTFPRILPKELRQNINGYLKMMYISQNCQGKKNEKMIAEDRKKFYSGSEITLSGLQENFGIQRTKMEELETNFKFLLNDRKSHVSMISIKVERGAGSTTMCLQFLFKYHEEYPCAQLIDFGDGLISYIKDICRETKLPLVLFVDEEIAHLQDFFEFTKDLVENRLVNVILLFIEPKEAKSAKREPQSKKESSSQRKAANNTRMKSASDHSIYGTCPYKEVILQRKLEDDEMDNLTRHLIDINKSKEGKLKRLRERVKIEDNSRTFVHFGLTAFGEDFLGLHGYVKFRLEKANKEQKTVLSYLSLIHVFTNSLLPANALADFLRKRKVNLEEEFSDPYLRELLSPAGDEMDSCRISFHEVAQEILRQLGSVGHVTYDWMFIKLRSVEMAKTVLSVNASTKAIDRLTRRLFVTSEYESEKFSSLIRAMTNDKHKNIARDTLIELVEVFTKRTSFGAHLLAHLAKYYMIEFKDYAKASPRIEEAVKNQEDDSLLRHIHGDIIRMHVNALKYKNEINMQEIVTHAIKSSDCFSFVRRKRPYVSHGYISDAMVRITVMQAAIKVMGGGKQTSFIDYLIQMIDDMKEKSSLFVNERYLLSLIPDVHQFLNEGVIDFDHKNDWKEEFRKCIGKSENLRRLCDKIKEEKHFFEGDDSRLLHDVSLQILILNNSLEIETKPLNPLQIENLVKEVYDPDSSRTTTNQQMKFWIRNSRLQKKVPQLDEVRKHVQNWVDSAKKKGSILPDANFYNYVINVMIAMDDPKDVQKREKAERLIKKQQGKKHKIKEDVLPLEWLHPKDKHHINSIDSLLHHDDLVKEINTQDRPKKKHRQPKRDVIEGFLFQKVIRKWEGTVKEILRDWQGTIVFKGHFDVRFVPQNVQPSMPSTGDTVRFCLSFDRLGLMAWAVIRAPQNNIPKSPLETVSSEEESCVESNDENDDEIENILDTTIFNQSGYIEHTEKGWEDYDGKRMQGVVVSTNSEKGYGNLEHPDIKGPLFFHAAQLAVPVKSLKGEVSKFMVLKFTVERLTERTRAANIRVITDEKNIEPAVSDYREVLKHRESKFRDTNHSSPSTSRREKHQKNISEQKTTSDTKRLEEGVVVATLSKGKDYGFIRPDNRSYGKDIIFHRTKLVSTRQLPNIGDRVQFYVLKRKEGYGASDIRVQNNSSSVQKWEQLQGIQEGFVDSVSDDGGNIVSACNPQMGYLLFRNKDVLGRLAQITDGTKVHFQVQKRRGKCVAIRINVIDSFN